MVQYVVRTFTYKSQYKTFFLALQKRFKLNIITDDNVNSITVDKYNRALTLYNAKITDSETVDLIVVQTVLYLLFQESPASYASILPPTEPDEDENDLIVENIPIAELRDKVREHFKQLGVKSLVINQSKTIPLNDETIAFMKTESNLDDEKEYYLSFITADYRIIRVNKIPVISKNSRRSKWFKLLKIIRTLKYGKISNRIDISKTYEDKINDIITTKTEEFVSLYDQEPTQDDIKQFLKVGNEYDVLSPDIVIIFHEQLLVNPELRYLRNGEMNCACKAIYDELTKLKKAKDTNWKIDNIKKINDLYLSSGIDDAGIQALANNTYYHIVIYDRTGNLWRDFEPKVKAQDKIILVAQNGHISLAPTDIEFGENNQSYSENIVWCDTVLELAQYARDYEEKDPLNGYPLMSKESIVAYLCPEVIYKLKFDEYEEYPDCFTSGGIGKSKFIKDHPEFKYGLNENNPFYDIINDADVSGFYLRLDESEDTNFKYDQNSAYKSFYKSGIFSGYPNIEAVFNVNKLTSEFDFNLSKYGLVYINYETLTTEKFETAEPVYYEGSGWVPIEIVKHNYINYGINPTISYYAYASSVWNTETFNEMTNEQFRNFLGKTTSKYSTGQWKTNNELEYMRARYILQDRILTMDESEGIYTISYKLTRKPWNMPIISAYVKAHQKFNLFNQVNLIKTYRYNDGNKINIIAITVDCIEVDKQCDNLFIIGTKEGQWKKQTARNQLMIEKYISERDITDRVRDISHNINEFKTENIIKSRYIHYAGAGGNGKTQHIINLSKSYLGMLFTAPTHEAVNNLKIRAKQLETNIKAETYHRAFGIGCYDNFSRENYTHIVIDECSMVSASHLKLMFDTVNDAKQSMVLSGDFYQLPCVNDLPMYNVETKTKSAEYNNFVIEELTTNYRQKEDPEFFKLCNQLRNPLSKKEALDIINKLNTRVKPITFNDYKTIDDFYICGINKQVDYVNDKHKMAVGSKIILNMNSLDISKELTKGSICEIVEMNDKILKVKYDNLIYEISAKKKAGYNLAYALTVHKSQGKTIRNNLIINPSRLFEKHHLYVALTRATKFDSIILTQPITMETMINTAYVIS